MFTAFKHRHNTSKIMGNDILKKNAMLTNHGFMAVRLLLRNDLKNGPLSSVAKH